MKPIDPRLMKYARAARRFLGLGAILAIVQTACIVGFAWLISQLVVRAIDGEPLDRLAPLLVALCGVIAVRAVTIWLLELTATRGGTVAKSELRRRVIESIARLGPGWVADRNAAKLATVTGPGLDALDNYFTRYLPQLILTAVATPVLLLVILLQDWVSAVSVLITLPLIPVFMILIGWATQTVQKNQWTALTTLASGFLDVVNGLSTLKLFGREKRQAVRIRAVTDGYRVETMKVLRVSFVSGFVLELASSLAVAVVAVTIGLRLIEGNLGLGVGLFVLLLAPEAFLPLRNVGTQFHAAADGVAAADDIFAIIDEAGVTVAAPDSAATDGESSAPGVVEKPTGETAAHGAALELDSVVVSYGSRTVLDGISVRFPAAAITAVTGPSGAGKSTLVAAVLGFVDYSGRIRHSGAVVDPTGTERPWLAWAGQRAGLSGGTVAENIALGAEYASPSLVAESLRLAGGARIDPATVLGVGGSGISGGQAQRVGIARAIYRLLDRRCDVLILDEPSSALDAESESRLLNGLRELADAGCAVVIVSHRDAVIRAADGVVALAPVAVAPVALAPVGPTPVAAEPASASASAAERGGTR